MALQGIQHPEYVGAEVDAGDAEHAMRVLRFFLRDGERVVALATTVKALPTLTHIAVTDRRILGFSAAELAKEGPRQETDIAVVASVETRKSYKQRWFFVVVDESGAETDFGDVHDQDAPRLTRIIEGLVRPSRPEADVPSPRLPEADPSPRAPEPGAPSPHTPGAGYVISNIGAFGERMVKIGMTRRLEPMDRVRELGDASVPFRFDVHALIFSEDAVGLENSLHEEFADRRVNRVNLRREFFYATPAEVREVLERLAGNHLLEYNETPEALEYRAGKTDR